MFGFVDAAGLIGSASQSETGLMPSCYAIYNEGVAQALDFNNLKDLGRLYCSYNSINGPVGGGYYWGIINIGWNPGYFIQIACGSYLDGQIRMYRRMFHTGKTWTSWTSF